MGSHQCLNNLLEIKRMIGLLYRDEAYAWIYDHRQLCSLMSYCLTLDNIGYIFSSAVVYNVTSQKRTCNVTDCSSLINRWGRWVYVYLTKTGSLVNGQDIAGRYIVYLIGGGSSDWYFGLAIWVLTKVEHNDVHST